MRVVGAIERMRRPSRETWNSRFVELDVPVVLEGEIDDWPARSEWSSQTLRARLGDVATTCKRSASHRHPDFGAADLATTFHVEPTTFAELIDRMLGPDASRWLLTGSEEFFERRVGASGFESNPKLAAIADDVRLPRFVPRERLRSSWFWMSGRGVRTWLHYDNNGCHNLNAQVSGTKRVWLFDPEQLAKLYPFELGGDVPAHNCCRVDFEAPDTARFPAFADATCVEGELRAGDLLFIPANWIHTFEHTGEFNVNVNFWWRPERARASVVALRQAFLDGVESLDGVTPEVRARLAELDRWFVDR